MDIKKELVINASASRVYDAITDMKQLSKWFPDVVSLEPKINGKIVFRFPRSSSKVSDTIEGKIVELEKNKKLSYIWSHSDVPNFPLTKVVWSLEQIEKNKTRVVMVHSGFVDENTMNSYNKRGLRITKHLDVSTVSEKPSNMQKQIASATIIASFCVIFAIVIGTFQNSDKFITIYLWSSLLVVSLISIPIINKYKKFSWKDKPMITSVGITTLAQIIVTAYWGFAIRDATHH